MKNIGKKIILFLGFFFALGFQACKEKIDPIVDELSYSRVFTPNGLGASISNATTLTLTWSPVKNVDHYVVEIYLGTDFSESALVKSVNVDPSSITYVFALPAGDTQYSARVKAVSYIDGVAESNWTSVAFRSAAENLFTGFVSNVTGVRALTVKWKPGSDVTALMFVDGTNQTSYAITSDELTTGIKNLTNVPNANYEIRLMNGTFVRGKINMLLEGDFLLNTGDDLAAAITSAPSGSVILLQNNASFAISGNYTITKNVKIKGISLANRATIYPATGASNTGGMLLIGPTVTDSIVFQNVILNGYVNNVAGTLVTAVYDMGTTNVCNIGTLKFKSCILQHFGRHVIRLRGTAAQNINSFEVDDCILNDFGSSTSARGIICSNTAGGKINNIKFSNSTVYSFSSQFIYYTTAAACQGITISNCTFNQLSTDATAQYFIDLNNTASTAPVTITNCIFGSASTLANGMRPGTMVIGMTNCYYTSDYADGTTYSVKSKMTAYAGVSTALWTAPVAGTFTFLDQAFVGKKTTGDPRWRP